MGRYGSTEGLGHKDCSGPCMAGYFCPLGSVSEREYMCCEGSGHYPRALEPAVHDPRLPVRNPTEPYAAIPADGWYCPEGSATALQVEQGYYASGGLECTRTSQVKCDESNDQHGRCPA